MTSISHHDSETGKVELTLPTTLGVSESETKWLFSEYFKVLYLLVIAVYKGSCAKVKFSPDFSYSISGRVDFSDGGVDFGLSKSDIENWREDRGHKTFWPNIWIIKKNSIVVTAHPHVNSQIGTLLCILRQGNFIRVPPTKQWKDLFEARFGLSSIFKQVFLIPPLPPPLSHRQRQRAVCNRDPNHLLVCCQLLYSTLTIRNYSIKYPPHLLFISTQTTTSVEKSFLCH